MFITEKQLSNNSIELLLSRLGICHMFEVELFEDIYVHFYTRNYVYYEYKNFIWHRYNLLCLERFINDILIRDINYNFAVSDINSITCFNNDNDNTYVYNEILEFINYMMEVLYVNRSRFFAILNRK